MRKKNFKLLRKTVEWLHRIKGAGTMALKKDISPESYKFFKIFGNGSGKSSSGVGDYSESENSYSIPMHIHGKNLIGGQEFMDIHSALGISKISATIVGGFYSTTPLPEHNGTVIIGPELIKFKKKTAYTIGIHFKFFTSATQRNIAMRFDYSDGTYYAPIITSTAREFKMCFTSDPNKDLVAISSNTQSASNIRFSLVGFGIYEGAYSDYAALHEPYNGYRANISLAAPLRKIDYTKDEAELISGIVTRKIHVFNVGGSTEFSRTEDEGVFEIKLPYPMRVGSRIVSPFEALSESCDSGLSGDQSGEKILFKASSDITDEDGLRSYLNENPFEISYVLDSYKYESFSPLSIPMFDEELKLEFLSSEEPSKSVAEYV